MNFTRNASPGEPGEEARFRDELLRDPLVRRYATRPPARITTPVDALGEQRGWALSVVSGAVDMRGPGLLAPVALAKAIRHATPFMWRHEIRRLALGYTMPKHVIGGDLFSYPAMWWTWETALDNGLGGNFDALLLMAVSGGYLLVEFGAAAADADDARVGVAGRFANGEFIRFGARYPDDVPSNLWPVISMLAFLNSPYVITEPRYAAVGKKRVHGHRPTDPQALHVIALRPAIHAAVSAEQDAGSVQWKNRWLVRGHYRAQWYSRTQSHKVIWIAPYLKGPEDAPLKTPIYAVVR